MGQCYDVYLRLKATPTPQVAGRLREMLLQPGPGYWKDPKPSRELPVLWTFHGNAAYSYEAMLGELAEALAAGGIRGEMEVWPDNGSYTYHMGNSRVWAEEEGCEDVLSPIAPPPMRGMDGLEGTARDGGEER